MVLGEPLLYERVDIAVLLFVFDLVPPLLTQAADVGEDRNARVLDTGIEVVRLLNRLRVLLKFFERFDQTVQCK